MTCARPHDRRGMVLLIVVVVVMLLSLAAYQFLLSMEIEHMAVATYGDRIVAEQAALSARDLLIHVLEQSRLTRHQMGGLQDNPAYFGGDVRALMQRAGEGSLAMAMPGLDSEAEQAAPFGIIAYPTALPEEAGLASELPATPVSVADSATPPSSAATLGPPTKYGARNESNKLHLMKLLEWKRSHRALGKSRCCSLPGMDESTAEAILDWLDEDSETRENGAEADFYSTLSRPLRPRNALISDLEELLFVKGVNAARLFDSQAPPPTDGLPPRATPSPLQLDPTTDSSRPWVDYLTIYSAERNESYAGEPRIFLNANDLKQLYRDLIEVMPEDQAKFIILFRQFGPSKLGDEVANAVVQSFTIDATQPAAFAIDSVFDLFEVSVTIPPKDESSRDQVVNSPFRNDGGRAEWPELFDRLTVLPEPRVVGRININEAPAQILAAIPGITPEQIEAIITARKDEAMQSGRVHPAWLLAEDVLDVDTMRTIAPHVTCGGDVFRADIWGRVDDRSPMVHFETVIDASTGQAQSVYHRELAAQRNEIHFLTTAELATLQTLESPERNGER